MGKRIVLFNDLPGYGKVALAAMVPLFSRMGHFPYQVPTAVVSNTLDFGKFRIQDMTDYMRDTIKVWDELGFDPDCICTGFVLSEEQVELIGDYIRSRKPRMDEIQNVVNSRNGKQLVGMLTQLINNSGISICMVGTPESIVFFEQAMQLARRSLGLQYEAMEFDKDFIVICKVLWGYLYTKSGVTLTDGIIEWLYEHSGGNISILVALIHDAQEISILEGRDVLDMTALEQAYQKRMAMLHDYLEPSVRRKKHTSAKKKKELITEMEDMGNQEKTGRTGDSDSVRMDMDGQEISLEELVADAKVRNLNIVEIFQKYFAVEEVEI